MINFFKKSLLSKALLGSIGLIIGLGTGFLHEHYSLKNLNRKLSDINPIRDSSNGYQFIHPLLSYNFPDANLQKEFEQLRTSLVSLVNEEKNKNLVSGVSIYFQALDEARWIGIDENDSYDPASLMKVILMMCYFKNAEIDPNILSYKLVYTEQINSPFLDADTSSGLKINESYSVEQLINSMIMDSDNGAMNLLLQNIDIPSFEAIFKTLGIKNILEQDPYVISPKTYSLFFRVLYNATFLDAKTSEKALQLLSTVNFKDGLVAGLPENILISHKFGAYRIVKNGIQSGVQLHDCGIVYYKPSPYFLCIMTNGSDFPNLKNVIADISALVWRNFSNLRK